MLEASQSSGPLITCTASKIHLHLTIAIKYRCIYHHTEQLLQKWQPHIFTSHLAAGSRWAPEDYNYEVY